MWPLLWKGIVVFTALAFISSVSEQTTQKSGFCTSALLFLLLLLLFFEKRFYIFCAQKNGAAFWGGWAQLPLLLCVCIFNTPVKHRNSDFSGFKVPPFSFKTQSGIFCAPWTDTVLPQVHRAAFPWLTLAGSFVWSLTMVPELPCPFLQALPSAASEKRRCEGKTPARGVLHLMVGMKSQKWDQMPTSAFSRASSIVPWVVTVSTALWMPELRIHGF